MRRNITQYSNRNADIRLAKDNHAPHKVQCTDWIAGPIHRGEDVIHPQLSEGDSGKLQDALQCNNHVGTLLAIIGKQV